MADEMGWACAVACMGETVTAPKLLMEKLERRDYLGDLSVDMKIILKCMLKK
jgi:hypothetical protein